MASMSPATFSDLAWATGKSISAVKKYFLRKKWSIQNPVHVRTYLEKIDEKRVQPPRPGQQWEHLKPWQFRSKQLDSQTARQQKEVRGISAAEGQSLESEQSPEIPGQARNDNFAESKPRLGRDVMAWVQRPRLVGEFLALDKGKLAILQSISFVWLTKESRLLGVVFTGSWPTLSVVAVFADPAAQKLAAPRIEKLLAESATRHGLIANLLPVVVSGLPATISHESNAKIRAALESGRAEYGWVSLPI